MWAYFITIIFFNSKTEVKNKEYHASFDKQKLVGLYHIKELKNIPDSSTYEIDSVYYNE